MKRERYHCIDNIRGITLISMIIYHGIWDLVYMFGCKMPWYDGNASFIWQQSICWSFILISGFCFGLGKKRVRRALEILAVSAVISVVTSFVPGTFIMFGVLNLLGFSMLFMVGLEKLCMKGNPYLGMVIVFLLFAISYSTELGYVGFFFKKLYELPRGLYANCFTAFWGFSHEGFNSNDYFPILPWFFLYQTGFFLFRIIKKRDALKFLSGKPINPFAWIGRKSLIIYALHQPVVYGILWIMNLIIPLNRIIA